MSLAESLTALNKSLNDAVWKRLPKGADAKAIRALHGELKLGEGTGPGVLGAPKFTTWCESAEGLTPPQLDRLAEALGKGIGGKLSLKALAAAA